MVEAAHPVSGVPSGEVSGSFVADERAAVQDIVFTGTGIIHGTVRRSDGTVVSEGHVELSSVLLLNPVSAPIPTDGQFTFSGLPAGTYTLLATLPNLQGTDLTGSTSATVTSGQMTRADITLTPTGGVSGIVRTGGGAPAINVRVELNGPQLLLWTYTDTGGGYTFLDVPVGSFTVSAIEPKTGLRSSVEVGVSEGRLIAQDIHLINVGTVAVAATLSDGTPAQDAFVQMHRSALGDFFSDIGRTDVFGHLSVDNVPQGVFTVRVFNPVNTSMFTEASGVIGSDGEVVSVPVVVPIDHSPTIAVTAPAANLEIIEGTRLTLRADASDDVGVARVELFVDGRLVGTDTTAPYTIDFRVPGGPDHSPVRLRAVATDTAAQTAEATLTITRRDDLEPPTVAITAPGDGSIASVGTIDVAIVIDLSFDTSDECGANHPDDNLPASVFVCEVLAAQRLLNFLNPMTTRVALVEFQDSARVIVPLTDNFAAVEWALQNMLDGGAEPFLDDANFGAALQKATAELMDESARREATPVQFLFSRGMARFPSAEITRAVEAGVIVNTLAVGEGATPTALKQIAEATGGAFAPVVNPDEMAQILPNLLLFGIDALVVMAEATDNVSVETVAFRFTSADGTLDTTLTGATAPFTAQLSLPELMQPLPLTVVATATDFGGHEAHSAPVAVTVFPTQRHPAIVRLEPSGGPAGTSTDIVGRFFDPLAQNNVVRFRGVEATITSGTKHRLQVRVPQGVDTGPVTVEAEGLVSNPVTFTLDTDSDGLSDAEEAAHGTEPHNPDSDADGLTDGDEVYIYGTDPLHADSDGDGLTDAEEVNNGLDPGNADDAPMDWDGDGLTNAAEVSAGTDLRRADSDFDGLTDSEEVLTTGTDPLRSDSDGGGRYDGYEVKQDGTDPLAPGDDLPLRHADDLYVLDDESGNILRIAPDGTVTRAVTRDEIVAATGSHSVSFFGRGIVFDTAHAMYFTEGFSQAILRQAPGQPVQVLTSREAISDATDLRFAEPKAITLGNDGLLYVNDNVSDSVLQVEPATGVVDEFVSQTQFAALPTISFVDLSGGIMGDAQGMVYTVSRETPAAVLAIALSTGIPSVLTSGPPLSGFNIPVTMAPNDDVVIAAGDPDTVYRITPGGRLSTFLSNDAIHTVLGSAIDSNDFVWLGGMAFDGRGNFYLIAHNHILQFDTRLAGRVFVSEADIRTVTGMRPELDSGFAVVPVFDADRARLKRGDQAALGTDLIWKPILPP